MSRVPVSTTSPVTASSSSSAPRQSNLLDRPLRDDGGSSTTSGALQQRYHTVSQGAFACLFAEVCHRANNVPTKISSVVESESRLAALGEQVGSRGMMLVAARDPNAFKQRPLTIDAALKLIGEKLWSRWFGRTADVQKDSSHDRYYVIDDDPLVVRHTHPTPDYIDSSSGSSKWTTTPGSFLGGVIRGALEVLQFPPSQVVSYHEPEAGKPCVTWFVIEFSPQVWERSRRGVKS